jgi:Delta7-sterol 5-desaturase
MLDPTNLLDIALTMSGHVFLFDFGRYLIAASLVASLVWLLRQTSWASRKIQKREATRADFIREFTASIRTVIVYVAVSIPVIWAFRNGWLERYEGTVGPLGFALYLGAILIAHDAWFYWAHRAMHTPLLYKRFHRFHHRTITPTAWTAYAFAVPEAFVMAIFVPLYAVIVPTPEPVLFTFLGVMILRNAMGHAGLELHARGWASHPVLKWISTTTHHDMHHGTSYNHNYGFYFTWWDKLMGTEHPDYVETFDRVTARPTQPATESRMPALLRTFF